MVTNGTIAAPTVQEPVTSNALDESVAPPVAVEPVVAADPAIVAVLAPSPTTANSTIGAVTKAKTSATTIQANSTIGMVTNGTIVAPTVQEPISSTVWDEILIAPVAVEPDPVSINVWDPIFAPPFAVEPVAAPDPAIVAVLAPSPTTANSTIGTVPNGTIVAPTAQDPTIGGVLAASPAIDSFTINFGDDIFAPSLAVEPVVEPDPVIVAVLAPSPTTEPVTSSVLDENVAPPVAVEPVAAADPLIVAVGAPSPTTASATCKHLCNNGECIPIRWKCDGVADCEIGEDEVNCTCDPRTQFHCQDQTCVDRSLVCDLYPDCADSSDEWCSTDWLDYNRLRKKDTIGGRRGPLRACARNVEFRCRDGACIPVWWVCDRRRDCYDKSDEDRKVCVSTVAKATVSTTVLTPVPTSGTITCKNKCSNGECIPLRWKCDGMKDCTDGEDEKYCFCNMKTQFQCENHECISRTLVCDLYPDCADASDERCDINWMLYNLARKGNTTFRTKPQKACDNSTEFRCRDGACISQRWVCDRRRDCTDKSDEDRKMCAKTTSVTTPMLTTAKAPSVTISKPPTAKAASVTTPKTITAKAPSVTTPKPTAGPIPCGITNCRCHNDKYIPKASKCDGKVDCLGGEDEIRCCILSDPFWCTDGQCISASWKCDGLKDCANGEDEANCFRPTAVSTANVTIGVLPCGKTRCRCIDDQYISVSQKCDGKKDCQSGEDELHCCRYSDPFWCNSTQCIPKRWQCDGMPDCSNYKDETNCFPVTTMSPVPTSEGTLACGPKVCRCKNGRYISRSMKCDNKPDCSTGEDEINCCKYKDPFWCSDGRCISSKWKCDKVADCTGGEDEKNCSSWPTKPTLLQGPLLCGKQRCQCYNKKYIPASQMCDGFSQCENGEDEKMCCKYRYPFWCNNGHCIPSRWRCDGHPDCGQGEDEKKCFLHLTTATSTRETTTRRVIACGRVKCRCFNDVYIPVSKLCDGHADCGSGEDERTCCNYTNPFWCSDNKCIPTKWKCDGLRDCTNGEDEENCSQLQCDSQKCQCYSKKNIPKKAVCDGESNCESGEDEAWCCKYRDPFWCHDKSCIPTRWKCDGQPDCVQGEDERNCVPLTNVTIRTPAETNATTTKVTQIMSHVPPKNVTGRTSAETNATMIKVTPIMFHAVNKTLPMIVTPATSPTTPTGALICGKGKCQCQNKSFIPINNVCDGQPDCSNGEDEEGCCKYSSPFWCKDGKCIPKKWQCDGTKDCQNGEDEENCKKTSKATHATTPSTTTTTAVPSGLSCSKGRCQCNGGQFISITSICDRKKDCRNGEDEAGCCKHSNPYWCKNGQCIDKMWKCNGKKDCASGEDETDCEPVKCGTYICRCHNGERIRTLRKCDGKPDCSNGEDEYNCEPKTRKATYATTTSTAATVPSETVKCGTYMCRCHNGKRIRTLWKCDGKWDCSNGEDEYDCQAVNASSITGLSTGVLKSKFSTTATRGFLLCGSLRCQCIDGATISVSLKCNGNPDCSKGEDEEDCKFLRCGRTRCRCRNGDTISIYLKCDGKRDCSNGEDEESCEPLKCAGSRCQCSDGQYIPQSWKCNKKFDCSGGEDEENCGTIICQSGKCRCNHKHFIPISSLCDGRKDCKNGEDEKRCCQYIDPFWCNDGQCIPAAWRCDGPLDCDGGEDEHHCIATSKRSPTTTTTTTTTRTDATIAQGPLTCGNNICWCYDGEMIPTQRLCDDHADCSSHEDEKYCSTKQKETTSDTKAGAITCGSVRCRCDNGVYISRAWRCDGKSDCLSGEDENNCGTITCNSGQCQCSNNRTIAISSTCDGKKDCDNGEDEEGCCKYSSPFWCDSSQCIHVSWRCDGQLDCKNGKDEKNCASTSTKPPANTTVVKDVLKCSNNECQCKSGVYIPRIWKCDGKQDCSKGEDEENCVSSSSKKNIPTSIRVTAATTVLLDFKCGLSKCRCKDGKYIKETMACDGKRDCAHGEDEENCEITTTSLPHKRKDGIQCGRKICRCNNGVYISSMWKCDGKSDCASGEDEKNCTTDMLTMPTTEGLKCGSSKCRCKNGTYIARTWVCDGNRDCIDGEDEINCRPRIIIPAYNFTGDHIQCIKDKCQCLNGQMIHAAWVCDKSPDCSEGEDEKFCDDKWIADSRKFDSTRKRRDCTNDYEFQCRDKECIPHTSVCDLQQDCRDGYDEDRSMCRKHKCECNQFSCGSGRCIPLTWLCNGKTDCAHGEDEKNCLHNPACKKDADCKINNAHCSHGVCQCKPTHVYSYERGFDECLKIVETIKETCISDLQCTLSAFGSECSIKCSRFTERCYCMGGFIYNQSQQKCIKLHQEYGSKCLKDTECATTYALCIDGTCKCKSTYVYSSSGKYGECLKIATHIKGSCILDEQCTSSAFGTEDSIECSQVTGKCLCRRGYIYDRNEERCVVGGY